MSNIILEINKIYQFKGTRYNSFLNGMSGLCKIEEFGKRRRSLYRTRIVRILLEHPPGSGNFSVPCNCEENDVEFAEQNSKTFEVFHYSMLPKKEIEENKW